MAHQFFFNPFILDSLPAANRGFDVVQDLSEPRLRMYITGRGVKTFFVRKRINGKDKRIIIGKYPETDIEEARAAVSELLKKSSEKKCMKNRKIIFRKFMDIYLANRLRRGKQSREKLIRAINRHLAPLFGKYLAEISLDDVKSVIANIKGAAIANRMQEFLQSVFKYALESGYIKENPFAKLPKIKQNRRTRPLKKSHFHKLIKAIEKEKSLTVKFAFLMLIYGFATKSRIFSMRWADLDFNQFMWGDMPLSDAAVVLLEKMPQNGKWVFPGRNLGHLTDPRAAWKRVVQNAGIPTLTMDDVYKFLIRKLTWVANKEDFRRNMNKLLDEVLAKV